MIPRVCVVSALYHPDLGGLGRQAQLLSERLRREGVELFVIARKMDVDGSATFSGSVEVVRVPSLWPGKHILEEVSAKNLLISLLFSVGCLFVLVRRRKAYDLVHFHGASIPLFLSLPVLKWMGKKVVAKVAAANLGTEAGSLRGRYWPAGNLLARLVRKVDAYVAISEEIRAGLVRDGVPPGKIHRMTNFVDPAVFRPPERSEKARIKERFGYSGRMLVLFAGRLVPRKGVSHLLEAWENVCPEFPDARLLILGDGPLKQELAAQVARLKIPDTVRFGGRVASVPEYLRAADIFALPSHQEGMSNSLLEAMASGVPVVASEIGGVVDVVESGVDGLLTAPGDAKGIAAALRRLLADPALRDALSQAALEKVQAICGLDSRVHQYRRLYETVLGAGSLRE